MSKEYINAPASDKFVAVYGQKTRGGGNGSAFAAVNKCACLNSLKPFHKAGELFVEVKQPEGEESDKRIAGGTTDEFAAGGNL